MSGVVLVEKCGQLIDQAYKEGPEVFESTAKSVRVYLNNLSQNERDSKQVVELRGRIERYQFFIKLQPLNHPQATSKSIEQGLTEVLSKAYKENPEAFKKISDYVLAFLNSLPKDKQNYDQKSRLSERADRYQFKIDFNRLKQAHAAGVDIAEDLLGFVNILHPNSRQCTEDELRELYSFGKKSGVFEGEGTSKGESFVMWAKKLYDVDVEVSWFQTVVQEIFGFTNTPAPIQETSSKYTYPVSCSAEILQQRVEINRVEWLRQQQIIHQMHKHH